MARHQPMGAGVAEVALLEAHLEEVEDDGEALVKLGPGPLGRMKG